VVRRYSTWLFDYFCVISTKHAFVVLIVIVQRRATIARYHEKVRDSENVFKWVKLRVSTLFTTTNLKLQNLQISRLGKIIWKEQWRLTVREIVQGRHVPRRCGGGWFFRNKTSKCMDAITELYQKRQLVASITSERVVCCGDEKSECELRHQQSVFQYGSELFSTVLISRSILA
jgi:hypothetical protein